MTENLIYFELFFFMKRNYVWMNYIVDTVPCKIQKNKYQIVNLYYNNSAEFQLPENSFFLTENVFKKVLEYIQKFRSVVYLIKENLSEIFITNPEQITFEVIPEKIIDFKYLAGYTDTKYFRLINSVHRVDRREWQNKQNYIEVSEDVYNYLRENIFSLAESEVKIDKKLDKINSIAELKSHLSDLTEDDKFELEKVGVIRRAYNSISSNLNLEALYHFFNFTIHNNELMAEGVIITNQNRDEQYLKILHEANSEDLEIKKKAEKNIDILSDYLESLDALKKHFDVFNQYKKFTEEVYDCEKKDELNQILEKYKILFE